MAYITITAEAEEALRQYNLRTTGRGLKQKKQNSDGTYNIELENDTLQRLREMTLEGQSWSDAIMALCSGQVNKAN